MEMAGQQCQPTLGSCVYNGIEIRDLCYFLVSSERGSFRRAAESLNVRQSSVSRGVQRLEDLLGVSLFERGHSGVRLTNAGQRFLSEARPAIEQLEVAVRIASASGRAEVGVLRIGILSSLVGGFLRELIQTYVLQKPEIRLDIREGSRKAHIGAVRRHQIDIAFLVGVSDTSDCETVEFWRERVHVALPKSHRLAGRRSLSWPDLIGERFIVSRFPPGPEVYDFIVRRAAEYGQRPEVSLEGVAQTTLMNLVGLGQGITLVVAAWTAVKLPDLVLRPLTDDEDIVPFSAVWSEQNDNPALRHFISIAHVSAGRVRRGSSDWAVETLSAL